MIKTDLEKNKKPLHLIHAVVKEVVNHLSLIIFIIKSIRKCKIVIVNNLKISNSTVRFQQLSCIQPQKQKENKMTECN